MKYETHNNFPKQFSFAKSLSGQYLFASENFAEAAGFDSPAQMIGLRDTDLVWKDWAELYRQRDIQTFQGKVLLNYPQMTRFAQKPDKLHQILTTKTALRDSQNQIVGVIGSYIDITEHQILKSSGHFDAAGKKFILNESLSALTFSKKQITLLQYIIMGYSAADIASLLNRSKRTIEGHIEHLKHKLQCTSKSEIIRWTVTSGLLHGIAWPECRGG